MNRWKSAVGVLAGRWQVPLLICAIAAAGTAVYRVKPAKQSVPFDALLADVLALAEAGRHFDAADAAANLLEAEPPPPPADRASLHSALADIIYRQELLRGLPNRRNVKLLLKHHEAALACGYRADGRAALRAAKAHDWLGHTQQAINAYRTALGRQPAAGTRRAALQGLVRLLEGQPQGAEEQREHIQALLDEDGVSPAYVWWALQHAVCEALGHDDVVRARELLTRHGQRFKRSDLKGYYDYLWAWAYVHEGRSELAEPLIDRAEQWLAEHPRVDTEMDQAGFLPAMTRWLRGRIALAEERPQAALARFDEALSLQSHGDLLVVATIGRAQALAMLERHAAAREAVRDAVARLAGDGSTSSIALPRLRQAVGELGNQRHDTRDYTNALAYLELALELTPEDAAELRLDSLERFGRANEEAAELAGDANDRRARHLAAARCYEQAADLARFEEPRYASLLWKSAGQFDRAGQMADARRLLLRFVEGRSLDPRMPQALLQLGQAYAVDGCFHEAIEHYRQLTEEFPRLEEASRAQLLTADCLVALGEEHYAEAEAILQSLLEDERVAPQAQVFRDALFALCDLLYQQRRHAAAISHMEDFLVFYPQDPECYRIRFMLADTYRRSAYALREDESTESTRARWQVSRQRFRRAAELFDAVATDGEAWPPDDEAGATYERLALFYHADCLFELNEPGTLEAALAMYRQVAARYQGRPAALSAQVQITNIYLRQGKLTEAARAVERARWLLGGIPDQAFAECKGGMDRDRWDRYLDAVRSSHLFRDVLAGGR